MAEVKPETSTVDEYYLPRIVSLLCFRQTCFPLLLLLLLLGDTADGMNVLWYESVMV